MNQYVKPRVVKEDGNIRLTEKSSILCLDNASYSVIKEQLLIALGQRLTVSCTQQYMHRRTDTRQALPCSLVSKNVLH